MNSGFLSLYEPLLEGKTLYQATPVDKKATHSFQKLSLHHQSFFTWQAFKVKCFPQTAAPSQDARCLRRSSFPREPVSAMLFQTLEKSAEVMK